MTTEQKFNAAVNVIRGLPKSGSYQPSNNLMLRFYAYFKQATEGKCKKSRPAFWDAVNRAKWDAWNKLGDMSSESAMEAYVSELHKIVETMSYTDNVAAFFDTIDSDIAVSKDDLLLVAGDVLKKTLSSPSTPTGTRESAQLKQDFFGHNGHNGVNGHNGHLDSEDEYIDTSEDSEIQVKHIPANTALSNGHAALPASEHSSSVSAKALDASNRVLDELRRTVSCLETDVYLLKERVSDMEKERMRLQRSIMWRRPSWWPLQDVSPALLAAIVVWPIVANRLVAILRRKK